MSTESGVLTVAVVNDYEVVVRGVAGLLEPSTDQLRVVELDVDLPVVTPVDVALYDTLPWTAPEVPYCAPCCPVNMSPPWCSTRGT